MFTARTITIASDQQPIAGGYEVDSPKDFAARIYSLLESNNEAPKTVEAEVVSESD